MKKIYLSPSQQYYNHYAVGATTEKEQCNRIAESCERALLRCGFDVMRAPVDTRTDDAIAASNAWGADLHIPIHTNAGGGRGCVVFVSKLDERHKKYGQAVYDAVSEITVANEHYGVRTARYDEITRSRGLCVYIECEFHDNPTDAQWIIDNTEAIGEAICKGICRGAGVAYAEKQEDGGMVVRYNKIEEAPSWAQDTVRALMDAGALKGDEHGNLDLSMVMIRGLVIGTKYAAACNPRYETIKDMPGWAQAGVKRLVDRGALAGTGGGKLDLSMDMLRTLLVTQNMIDENK